MRWEHERALQALAEIAHDAARDGLVYAEETDVAARHLAERRGFVEERWFTTMVRDPRRPDPRDPRSPNGIRASSPYTPPPSWKEATRSRATTPSATTGAASRRPRSAGRTSCDERSARPLVRVIDLSWPGVTECSACRALVALALGSVNEDDWEGQGYSSVYIDLIGVTRDRRGRGSRRP